MRGSLPGECQEISRDLPVKPVAARAATLRKVNREVEVAVGPEAHDQGLFPAAGPLQGDSSVRFRRDFGDWNMGRQTGECVGHGILRVTGYRLRVVSIPPGPACLGGNIL